MGKLTISVALFSSYVRLPEGKRKKMCECADLIYIPSANPIYTSHLHTYHVLTNFKCVSKNDFMECGSKLLAATRFLWAGMRHGHLDSKSDRCQGHSSLLRCAVSS